MSGADEQKQRNPQWKESWEILTKKEDELSEHRQGLLRDLLAPKNHREMEGDARLSRLKKDYAEAKSKFLKVLESKALVEEGVLDAQKFLEQKRQLLLAMESRRRG